MELSTRPTTSNHRIKIWMSTPIRSDGGGDVDG